MDKSESEENNSNLSPKETSRRNFLYNLGLGVSAWLLACTLEWTQKNSTERKKSMSAKIKKVETVDELKESTIIQYWDIMTLSKERKLPQDLGNTLLCTYEMIWFGVFLDKLICGWLLVEKNVHENTIELWVKIKTNFIKSWIESCAVAPVIEEIIFRWGFQQSCKMFMGMDMSIFLTNIFFAWMHNVGNEKVDVSYIPLQQFIYGMYFSYLTEKKNIGHAIASHMAVNFTALVLPYLSKKLTNNWSH